MATPGSSAVGHKAATQESVRAARRTALGDQELALKSSVPLNAGFEVMNEGPIAYARKA